MAEFWSLEDLVATWKQAGPQPSPHVSHLFLVFLFPRGKGKGMLVGGAAWAWSPGFLV